MKKQFDPAEFVRLLGHDLIRAFEFAREATTSGLVGDAIEKAVRDRLEQILPRGIGVGSGCVIDSKGNTSRQMDVVLYEQGLCPEFCVNNNPVSTYYPAEAVMAVGEIKSAIGKQELADSFEKIKSVKALYRAYEIMQDGLYVGRRYGDSGSGMAHAFYRDNTNKGDIFGFVLAEKSTVAVTLSDPSKTHTAAPKATLLGHYVENVKNVADDTLCPDFVVFLNGTILSPEGANGKGPYTPARVRNVLPHVIHPISAESPFAELIKRIWRRYREGLTAHIPLETYLHYNAKTEPNLTWAVYANVSMSDLNEPKVGDRIAITTPTDHISNELQQLARKST